MSDLNINSLSIKEIEKIKLQAIIEEDYELVARLNKSLLNRQPLLTIFAELSGETIGLNGSMKNMIEDKVCRIRLSIYPAGHTSRSEYILTRADAEYMINSLNECLNDKTSKENGFSII